MISLMFDKKEVKMWIEIFRTGTFTDSSGITETFTESDLDKIARKYNEKVEQDPSFEAPLVKGHPKSDSPAYGWVERLARRGSVLYAKLKSLTNEIIEDIRQGKFRRVSISLYPDYLLRHIGLLGGETPAVKGLKPISFVELDDSRTFEYSEAESHNFSELREEIRRLEIENSQLAHQNQALRESLEKSHQEFLARSFRDFIERINNSSEFIVIPPAKEQLFLQILEYSEKADQLIRSNSNGSFPENFSLLEKIKEFFTNWKPMAIRKEYAQPAFGEKFVQHEFEGKKIDEERLDLHLRARELQKHNPELSYEQALSMINKL
jgi:hypothetical protein